VGKQIHLKGTGCLRLLGRRVGCAGNKWHGYREAQTETKAMRTCRNQ